MTDGQTKAETETSDPSSTDPETARDDVDLPSRDLDAESSDGRSGSIGTLVEAICTSCRLTRAKRTTKVDPDEENPTETFKHVCHACQSATYWNTLRALEDARREGSR